MNRSFDSMKARFGPGAVLCNTFKVEKYISKGGRGGIFQVVDPGGTLFAAKLEDVSQTTDWVTEFEVLKALLGNQSQAPHGFPTIRFNKMHDERYNVMVMDLLGDNMDKISDRDDFSVQNGIAFAVDALSRLETIHSHGFVHADIKPSNFALGRDNQLYIIDFGLSVSYIDSNTGVHKTQRSSEKFHGTPSFSSLDVHRGFTPSRKDDLESLGYSLVDMIGGGLPWDDMETATSDSNHSTSSLIGREKECTTLAELCEHSPRSVYDFMVEVTCLSYAEKPDYDKLRKFFSDALSSMQAAGSGAEKT